LVYKSAESYTQNRGYQVFLNADKEYRRSLIETLTIYLSKINDSIKSIKPNLKISVAVKPDPVQAKHRYFQDWITWLREKACDFIVLMNYRTDWNEYYQILEQVREKGLEKEVIVGISTYNQNTKSVIKRLDSARRGGFAGFSLFSYNYLIKNKNYLGEIKLKLSTGGINGPSH
jgi:uncharacterized lipoprotein YddW (UPF0748 family)